MKRKILPVIATLVMIVSSLGISPAVAAPTDAVSQAFKAPKAKFSNNIAFDISPALRDLAAHRVAPEVSEEDDEAKELREEHGPEAGADNGFSGDGAVQTNILPATISGTNANFEGLSNLDNFNIFGGRVNPPDPVGDVGPNHYVEMVNLTFAVYSKSGSLLLGPVDTGTLWAGFV
ncbi:MAG TPA: hypothetical protein VN653_08065, partial [Anaerolineales bacterium]|nr:hypothetical protein [Anaerolineales bacterium]